jgi:secreted trypsin-like serine protease
VLVLTTILDAPAVAAVERRIIGGSDASAGSAPWMAALVEPFGDDPYDSQFCGGSLIAPQWVLTAAHCFLDWRDRLDLRYPPDVVLGSETLNSDATRISTKRIVTNPDYRPDDDDGDIALLELSRPVDLPTVGLPGPIFDTPFATVGEQARIYGWGNQSVRGESYPEQLQVAELPIVDQAVCTGVYSGSHLINDNMLCAGDGLGSVDSCQGDSGGPLIAIDSGLQIGITSFGDDCAQFGSYGVYTRVARYADWISGIVCQSSPPLDASQPVLAIDGNRATLAFDPVEGATGYRIWYAPLSNLSPIRQLDIGNTTTISATFPSGTSLLLAVQPYHHGCNGPFSELLEMTIVN